MRTSRLIIWIFLLTGFACSTQEDEMDMEIQTTNPVNIEENAMVNCILEDLLCEIEKNVIQADYGTNIKDNTKRDSFPLIKIQQGESEITLTTLSIDYGNSNQIDHLGRLKRGKITTQIKGRYSQNQSEQKIQFNNFHINEMKIDGLVLITSNGYNEYDQPNFSISYDSLVFTCNSGLTYSISGNKSKEWIEGFETPENPWDDQFLISGDSYGVNSENREYQSKILTPLLISRACEFILSGETEFTIEDESAIYNFGDGLCDNKGSYIRNNEKHQFEFGRYTFRQKN